MGTHFLTLTVEDVEQISQVSSGLDMFTLCQERSMPFQTILPGLHEILQSCFFQRMVTKYGLLVGIPVC